MCFTHGQIREIIKSHRSWLRTEGYANFFLFKSRNNFFVAYAGVGGDGGLEVRVHWFEFDNVMNASYRLRVFVPALAAKHFSS